MHKIEIIEVYASKFGVAENKEDCVGFYYIFILDCTLLFSYKNQSDRDNFIQPNNNKQ